jgi:hypothetical protein
MIDGKRLGSPEVRWITGCSPVNGQTPLVIGERRCVEAFIRAFVKK